MFLDFIYNISLLVACFVLYALMPHQRLVSLMDHKPVRYRLIVGVLTGGLGVLVISHALTFTPGIIFDARSVILCVAAALFGPLVAVVSASICIVYRLWLGGSGAIVGVIVIAESSIFGVVYYYLRQRNPRLKGYLPLYALGLLVHGTMLLCMLGMPAGIRIDVLRSITIPVVLLYPLSVVLLGRIFFELEDRRLSEISLASSERNYHDLVELAGCILLRWKPDGTIVYVNECAEKIFGFPRHKLLGASILDTILSSTDSEGRDQAAMLRQVAARPEAFSDNECECVCNNSTKLWVSWSNQRIPGGSVQGYEILSVGYDITRRRDAERRLARSEEQYRRIVETVHEGIWSVDSNFITTFVNKRLCDMLGYAADEMLGRRIDAFLSPEDIRACAADASKCMAGKAGLYERRFVRREGSVLWALVSATPIQDEKGAFAGSLATLTDITLQKQNVERMRQSEFKFHTLFENMTQGVFYQSIDGTLTDINPAGLRIFGLTREAFLQRTSYTSQWNIVDEFKEPLPPEQHPSMQALSTGRAVLDRVVGIFNECTRDYVWVVVNAIPQIEVGGEECSGVVVTLHDITGRIQAQREIAAREQQVQSLYNDAQRSRKALLSILEDDRLAHEALHESEDRFRSVVETATDAIITLDGAGNIIVWNRAATQVFGYEYDEIIGKPFALLLPAEVEHQHIVGILHAIEKEVLPSPLKISEAVGLKKDGSEFPAEIAFGAVVQKGCTLITAIVRDITDRKLIEQEALRSAQLVSIGELAAGVAHEINNPIMGVINYAQIMLNKISKQGGETDIPERIIKEGTRIAGIVSNLLSFSRAADDQSSPVPVRAIFEPSFQLVQKLFQQGEVDVEVRFNDELPRVMVRLQKMQQVFINLLSNALYALNVRFPEPNDDKKLEIWSQQVADSSGVFVRVVFLDHGCGIPPEHLARICNPFFTTKPAGQGTGLGLSISHTIVKEHGGRLLFESELGQYTRVMVDLPAEQ